MIMRRSITTNFLLYLFTISLLWMPKGLSRSEKAGFDLANGKLTILTAERFGPWKYANSGERQSLTKIEIAEGIRNNPVYSFRDMLRLQSVRIIEERAFQLVFIPASIQKIGSVAFLDCKELLFLSFAKDANLGCVDMAANALGKFGKDYVIEKFYEPLLSGSVP